VHESCLIDESARVDSLPPVWRFVIGPKLALGPTHGVRLTGLPTGPRTVYFVDSDYLRLALRPGEAVTASTLHGVVVEVSDTHGSAFVNGASRRERIRRIPAAFPIALIPLLLARLGRRRIGSGPGQRLLLLAEIAGVSGILACGAVLLWWAPTSWTTALGFVLSAALLLTAQVTVQRWSSPSWRRTPPNAGEAHRLRNPS
jgi:hypothetical protein